MDRNACGTSGISPAEQARMPDARGYRSSAAFDKNMIFAIAILLVVVALVVATLFGSRRQNAREKIIQNKYRDIQSSRNPLSDSEFCARARLAQTNQSFVCQFRTAFSDIIGSDPQRIYPEDDISSFGFVYDDDVAMFLNDQGLLRDHPSYRYSFPLDRVSDFSTLVSVTKKLNEEIEQSDASNECPPDTR